MIWCSLDWLTAGPSVPRSVLLMARPRMLKDIERRARQIGTSCEETLTLRPTAANFAVRGQVERIRVAGPRRTPGPERDGL